MRVNLFVYSLTGFGVVALTMSMAGLCAAVAGEADAVKVDPALRNSAEWPRPGQVRLSGWLGTRVDANATNRLLNVDTAPLLAGFQKKPGTHPWIGEHVGKWMHAASLAWAYAGDPRLKTKLDDVAASLMDAQESNGYLGTYVPEQRFGLLPGADWDVWSHKYNLIGLLTYYEYTGNERALATCKRMGDLLVRTFGPDKKSILRAGTHVGMAATSVLEPMVLLHRFTGDQKYLEFCRYILRAWEEPNGPMIIQSLLAEGRVDKTANAKAYEMLSNLVGLCELARTTGERDMLRPVLAAWNDIVTNRLYITGSASQAEHFRENHSLPNESSANVAETCVTTTWIQLNSQLLRLTGEARFANELEKTFYNHLAAAQHPQGNDWCYFTPLSGRKPYDSGINCCHSSGPRGMALAPWHAYLVGHGEGAEAVLVSTFETSAAKLRLNGADVEVRQTSRFPFVGGSELEIEAPPSLRFAVGVRVPSWIKELTLQLNGQRVKSELENGWLMIPVRTWARTEKVSIEYTLAPSLEPGTHGNAGLAALKWGPFVMAYDSKVNNGLASSAAVAFAKRPDPSLDKSIDGHLRLLANIRSRASNQVQTATFVTFGDAGAGGGSYHVWLPGPDAVLTNTDSLLFDGEENRSRNGNVQGSINDGDRSTFVVTFDGTNAERDWFEVVLTKPAKIGRIVFVGGNVFHDGGWFDVAKGKPQVQIQSETNGAWETIATLKDYPEATSTDPAGLGIPANRIFEVRLESPVRAVGVRVEGKPSSGDNPDQSFSSCAELEAYEQ